MTIYSVLYTLSEYTYFYISKNICNSLLYPQDYMYIPYIYVCIYIYIYIYKYIYIYIYTYIYIYIYICIYVYMHISIYLYIYVHKKLLNIFNRHSNFRRQELLNRSITVVNYLLLQNYYTKGKFVPARGS